MKLLFSKSRDKDGAETIGFEPEEQKTPWLGRILLVILAVVLLYFGWRGLEDLGRIPKQPETISNCSTYYTYGGRMMHITAEEGGYKDNFKYTDYNYETGSSIPIPKTCQFSKYEQNAGVPTAYNDAQAAWQAMDNASRATLTPLETRLSSLQAVIRETEEQYNTSLREITAGRLPVGRTTEELRIELQNLISQENSLQQQIIQERTRLQQFESALKQQEKILVERVNKAIDLYNDAWAGYKFWVFLLELLLVMPFFAVSVWQYMRLLKTNSPHTIILLPVVFVSSMLLARTIILYFWALFLADIIEMLLAIFAGPLVILRIFLYYIGMFLAILIFGGTVYLLQRKIYAPARVTFRRLRSRKCPHCETPFEFTQEFCAGCGKQLLTKCASCGQAAFIDFKFCPRCGAKKG